MRTISAQEARAEFADVVGRAEYAHDWTVITKRGKKVAAVISMEDLAVLEECLRRAEDEIDREAAKAALAEAKTEGVVPWETLKSELGL
ncbi:MAG: type II toxin-antitoxin system Phd/YefM family antitoxin [Armatimonadota bacterium]